MKILLISQYYYPEPVQKYHDLARELARLGHDVTVLTGFPCYPKGRIYDGYDGRWIARETIDGVRVVRVPQVPDHSRSAIRRATYYLSFAASASVAGSLLRDKPDVVLLCLAALPIGLTGWIVSAMQRVPMVVEVADIWPESVASSGMMSDPRAMAVMSRIAAFVYRRAHHVAAVTHGFKRTIVDKGIDPDKISIIYNWVPTATYGDEPPPAVPERAAASADRFVVCYAGNMGPYQDVGTILDAAERLREHDHIEFVLIGDGLDYEPLQRAAAERGLQNVRFLGRKPPEEMPALLDAADLLVVHLKPDPLTDVSIPSKTFAYMATGKPILMAVRGDAEAFVQEFGVGKALPPCDPEAMAAGILELSETDPAERRALGDEIRRTYRDTFSGEVQTKRFEALLEEAIRAHR